MTRSSNTDSYWWLTSCLCRSSKKQHASKCWWVYSFRRKRRPFLYYFFFLRLNVPSLLNQPPKTSFSTSVFLINSLPWNCFSFVRPSRSPSCISHATWLRNNIATKLCYSLRIHKTRWFWDEWVLLRGKLTQQSHKMRKQIMLAVSAVRATVIHLLYFPQTW